MAIFLDAFPHLIVSTTSLIVTQRSNIVTEQERSLSIATSLRPHTIRKAQSVRAAPFQARGC